MSFLAAGQEHEQVPEIVVDDRGPPEYRGALSYIFARAVEGRADFDGDGVLRRDELWRFVRENVRMRSEARQTPNLIPNARGGEPVLRLSRPGATAADGAGAHGDQAEGGSGALRLAVLDADSGTVAAVRDTVGNVRIVSIARSPDLIWDARSREVVTGLGDVVAREVGLEGLPAVVDKWEAVRRIRVLSTRASLRVAGVSP